MHNDDLHRTGDMEPNILKTVKDRDFASKDVPFPIDVPFKGTPIGNGTW